MKKRNGWCYAFWILIMVVLIMAMMVGLIAWSGTRGDETAVSSVSISPTSMSLKMGETETGTLTATVTMDDGTTSTTQTVNWTSSDPTVATVTETGYTASVTALQAGETKITASVGKVTSTECTVTVAEADPATVTDVSLSDASVAYGSSVTLTATVTMSDGSDYEGDYAWESSDESVATVASETTTESSVTVAGVKCGTAEITVSVGEGDNVETDTCTVTVSEDHEAAEAGRVVAVDPADERLVASGEVKFDESEARVTYDASSKTYTVSGVSGTMSEEQANAFWGSTEGSNHIGHEYIAFEIKANSGETIEIASYNGTTPGNSWTMHGTAQEGDADGVWVIDVTPEVEGDFSMVLNVTYAGGDEEPYTVVLGDIEKGVATAADLQTAVAAGEDVTLTQDIALTAEGDDDPNGDATTKLAATLTIGDGINEVDVTLDLNGYTLARYAANSSGYSYDTIHVTKNATLTVTDSSEDGTGVVDVNGHGNRALYNEGTTILKGGFFERSSEAGMEESDKVTGTKDSAYTIYNVGDLTIEDGATVFNAGDFSTSIRSKGSSTSPATLTMNGGKVYGGKYAVGSGENATFTMTGGTLGGLRSDTDALPYRALNNYDDATITGGTLLGGNGGSIDTGEKPDMCVEGVVIFNEDGGTNHTLTIGDGKGNGPEIIYEGINPEGVPIEDGGQAADTRLSYYREEASDDDDETPAFATGIAVYSGEVDFNAGTIKCSDTNAEKEYTFMGVYLTNGTLNVSGGKISGDYAIVIDHTASESYDIEFEISGGEFEGDIMIYTQEDEEGSVFTPDIGAVIVPSEEFTFNEGTFDGFSGLDGDNLTITDESNNEVTYVAGDITVTEIVDNDGKITFVVDGIVANQMSDEQKVAFDASYENDNGEIRFYIAVKIAVNPGETVTVSAGGESETIENTGDEVIYDLWVIEINQSHFTGVTADTVGDYLAVDLSNFTMSVSVTDSESNEKGGYTVTFGNVFVPGQAWKCASDQHTVSSWTVTEEATCGTAGSKTGTCDYCGKTVEGVIPATGLHAATAYDGTYYAVYCADSEAWCALCETCGQWFEIEKCEACDIYSFVLLAKDEDSLDAAIKTAGEREDGSETNRTQILVYGTIEISETSYVKIDCDNVEIYGLGADSSKIIESAYETDENSGKARDGVEITGSNVTIRDLTIDGTKLNESSTHNGYEHGLEILEGASNVTLSGCVIIGGTSSNSSAVVLMGSNITGYILIENCTLSGYHGIFIERNDGDELDVTISGGKIDGAYYGILTEGLEGVHTNGVYLEVKNATINGKNSLGAGDSFTFTNCTFGFGVNGSSAYGSMNTYCDVTLIDCTFLANNTGVTSYTGDTLVYNSNNYVIQARVEGVTISLIDCEFENTYADLGSGTLGVTADNFVYIVGGKSSVTNCYLYFDDSDDAVKYAYDTSSHTVTVYNGEEPGDENP